MSEYKVVFNWNKKNSYLKYLLKYFRYKLYMIEHLKKEWLKYLNYAQENISNRLKNKMHYNSTYRISEVFAWEKLLDWLYKNRNDLKIHNSLNIGCGYGTLSVLLSNMLDIKNNHFVDFIDVFVQRFNVPYDNFNINNIELDDFNGLDKFDLIILTEVIEHFNYHPLETLKKINELLSDKGILLLSTPDSEIIGKIDKYYNDIENMAKPGDDIEIVDDHVYIYNKEELEKLFSLSGFKIIMFSYSPNSLFKKKEVFNYILKKA